jgi:DNA-binding transcriptional ArsR family regulator
MMATLRALAEPNRFQIVELLRDGPRPVGDMVDQLRLRQPQVSKHLRVLSAAGLVDVRVDAQRRIYALRPAALQELEVWLERYRRLWEENYQRLDAVLEELKPGERKTRKKKLGRTKR